MRLGHSMQLGANAMDARDRFDPEHRRKHLNASEADTCIRKQWYDKNTPEKGEEQSWGYARRGHAAERYIVEVLRLANVDLRLAGDDQKSLVSGLVSATPDGVIVDHDAKILIGAEFKSIDPRVNKKKLPKFNHPTQAQLGMCMIDEHALSLGLPDYPMDHGILMYLDASDYDVVNEYPIPYVPTAVEDIMPRAEKLLRARSANSMPREGKMKGGHECKTTCAFKAICLAGDDVTTATSVSGRGSRGSRLDTAVQSYWMEKTKEADAKLAKDQDAERIKAELKARKINEIEVGDRTVKLTQVSGRTTLDKKAVAASGVDLSPYEKTGAPSERLTIT